MDISSKIDNPRVVELFASLDTISSRLGIPFFIVGATARDMVLWHGFGIRPGRATRDVDIGVRVSSWEQYEHLRSSLESTGHFVPARGRQRLLFKSELIVDVLPFGDLVDADKAIAWPPDGDTQFSLLGFDEAHSCAISVRISANPIVEVKVASAVGLVLLKLFAWEDRQPASKDAIDLGILIRSYMQLGNGNRLFEDHADLLENENFDYDVAGAHILGRDLAQICEDGTRARVLQILDRELSEESDLPLVVQSSGSSPQINRTREFWEAIRHELRAFGPGPET